VAFLFRIIARVRPKRDMIGFNQNYQLKGLFMKAVTIAVDGTKAVVDFEKGNSYELLRSTVEGWIECVSLSPTADMWINEEGKVNGLPQNPTATGLWVDLYGYTDVIMGNVIITGGADGEGETMGLTDEQVDYYLSYERKVELLQF
jgi:hypothetical protein